MWEVLEHMKYVLITCKSGEPSRAARMARLDHRSPHGESSVGIRNSFKSGILPLKNDRLIFECSLHCIELAAQLKILELLSFGKRHRLDAVANNILKSKDQQLLARLWESSKRRAKLKR